MKFMLFTIIFIYSFCITNADDPNSISKSKLQIGIKKRVRNCALKTKKGDFLHVHYVGALEDGSEIDNSLIRDQPLTFSLGSGQVIKGWDQGLIGMCEGERRKLVIPPELAYGKIGVPPKIPWNATLTFEIDLIKIERRNQVGDYIHLVRDTNFS